MAAVLALDIGGTKLAAAVVGDDGSVLVEDRRPTAGADGEALFGAVTGLLGDVLERAAAMGVDRSSLAALGVGCGGPMAPGGEQVSPLNIPQWRDFPLRARLAEWSGLPTTVDNDAKALALGEGWVGAAKGVRDYLAMVVSTGVGGGIVLDRRLLDGAAGNAGHIGHVIVDPLGRPCACGARGCLEAQVSGSAIAAVTGRPAADAPEEVRVSTGRLVGRAVASVCNLLDLQLAAVAGSVALGFGTTFFDAANAELARSARLEFSRGARIVPSGCGAQGPIVGAAAVGLRGIGRDVGVA
jgi:glucokinase